MSDSMMARWFGGSSNGGMDMANPASLQAGSPTELFASLPASPNMAGGSNFGGGLFGFGAGQLRGGEGMFGGSGLGLNMGTAQLGISGLQGLGNLYAGMQAQGLARRQFDFTKGITETNLANQIKSFNTNLEDKARARGAATNQTQAQTEDYIARNRLSR